MDNLFLIIEGPDNVGKSTLITGLKNHFNRIMLHTLHYSNVKQPTTKDTITYSNMLYRGMFDIMVQQSNMIGAGVICDRSHLGELVYGPIYRGYTGLYVIDIESYYKQYHHFWSNLHLITLIDNPENLINRDDGLSFSTNEMKKQTEINNFMAAHDKSLIKHKLLLNIYGKSIEDVLGESINFIKGDRFE